MYKGSAKDKYKQNPPKSAAASNMAEKAAAVPEIDQILVDRTRRPHKQYLRGRFLGKVRYQSASRHRCIYFLS